MPLIDKPIAELLRYEGRNPRPANFDTYWDESLRELDVHDFKAEFVPNTTINPPHAECFDLWFTGTGGARVHAKFLRPRVRGGPSPAVLQFHGYSASSGDWFHLLPLVGQGFCVAALDCRGQGGASEDAGQVKGNTLRGHIIRGLGDPDPKKLYYRHQYLDTVLLARIVMGLPEVDAQRVGALGGSQGGGLAFACAALEPRIRRAVAIYPFLCDYQRVWEMDLAKEAYEELRGYFRAFDPCHEREREIFTKLGYIDCQHLAPRIRGEVLMVTGLMDVICPPSTQFAAYNKITSPKDYVLYPDYGHENYIPGASDRAFEFMLKL